MKRKEKKIISLKEIPRKSLFSVPEGYFEQFPQRMGDRISHAGREKQYGGSRLFSLVRPQIALAFGFVALALMAYLAVELIKPPVSQVVPVNIMAEFLEQNAGDLDEIMLLEMVAEKDILFLPFELDAEDIIEYLLDEDIDEWIINAAL